jgi:NADH-quinone oxidoreductase subunit A
MRNQKTEETWNLEPGTRKALVEDQRLVSWFVILTIGCKCAEFSGWTPLRNDSKGTMDRYFGFILLVLFAAGTVGTMVAMSQWLGPRRKSRIHDMPFECGMEPTSITRGRFSVKFFVVALLFILFDIELIFLFAWAVIFRELGLFGFVEMLTFLLVVVSGLFYSINKGVLHWK